MVVKTYCSRMDHGGCGLLVHVEDGRIVRVEIQQSFPALANADDLKPVRRRVIDDGFQTNILSRRIAAASEESNTFWHDDLR